MICKIVLRNIFRRTRASANSLIIRKKYYYENNFTDNPADNFKCIYDFCMVRASQIQIAFPCSGYSGKLADSVCGILFSGSCQPYGTWHLLGSPVENHTGNNHADCFFRFLRAVSRRRHPMESSGRLCADLCRSFFYLQKMVKRVSNPFYYDG